MKLPDCRSRHETGLGNGRFVCTHPKVHARDSLVTASICKMCRYSKAPAPENPRPIPQAVPDRSGPCMHLGEQIGLKVCPTCRGDVRLKLFACGHPLHSETTFAACRQCPDYEPLLTVGGVRSWAAGVTTAPRTPPTLQRSIDSLNRAGWANPRLFSEPESPLPERLSVLQITRRDETAGAWPNWYLGLAELVLRHPFADAYLMAQDDVVFCQGLREYLQATLWPAPKLGVVSLYCPSHYSRRRGWGYFVEDRGWDAWGALAYVFPNSSARALLADPRVVNHRQRGPARGLRNVDSVVGRWCRQAGLDYYVHCPSLAQHVGERSTIFPGNRADRRRRASNFVGESFDVRSKSPERNSPVSPEKDSPEEDSPEEDSPRADSNNETSRLAASAQARDNEAV